jgi:O-methyltransferase involved in polyketide biosynthesis
VLDPGFADTLAGLLDGTERPLVAAEGLLSYFDLRDRAAVFGSVAHALRGGAGVFVSDLHSADAQARVGGAASVLRFAIQTVTRRRRALDPYATREELLAAIRQAGFARVEIVDPAQFVPAEPRLASVRSPAHIVVAGSCGSFG